MCYFALFAPMNRPFASAWHLPVAGLLLALLWLSVGCQGAADPKTESADAVKADSISVDKKWRNDGVGFLTRFPDYPAVPIGPAAGNGSAGLTR